MRTTRIDLEGQDGHYAIIQRKRGSEYITATILTPAMPNGREHHVLADCEDDLFSMAECMQETLDGCRGTNSMVHDYFREIQRFAD
mgnify:CR=1 FL=1